MKSTTPVLFIVSISISTFFQVKSQYNFACKANFCSSNVGPCPDEKCEDGRVIKNATQCGCCDICVKSLKLGEGCNNDERGTIPRVECGPGLMCIDGKCQHADTKCVQNQIRFDATDKITDFMTSKPRPECDDFGDYKSVSCRPDMLCFCVDKDGNRIFGTASYSERHNMNCNCSRDFSEFQGTMRRSDQFLICRENGNYDPLQCTTTSCFCMDDQGKLDGRSVDVNTTITTLKCYDAKRHKGMDQILRTKCWRDRDAVEEQVENYRLKGITVVGADLPQCELDGSYGPVQCKGDSCFCVKKDGSQYEPSGYRVIRNSALQRSMNCRCAREKELIRKADTDSSVAQIFIQYKCLPNGNYQPMQCLASTCFCIDDMGFQVSETVLMQDRFFLNCYDDNYEV